MNASLVKNASMALLIHYASHSIGLNFELVRALLLEGGGKAKGTVYFEVIDQNCLNVFEPSRYKLEIYSKSILVNRIESLPSRKIYLHRLLEHGYYRVKLIDQKRKRNIAVRDFHYDQFDNEHIRVTWDCS